MNPDTDLTDFWLAWQKTCAIRLCTKAHEAEFREKCSDDNNLLQKAEQVFERAREIIQSTNEEFQERARKSRGNRLSSFSGEMAAWSLGDSFGSAFELLESQLYAKVGIYGKKFKDYLFEDIANRPGGMNKNLYGYLQRILRTIADESFGEIVHEPMMAEDGTVIEPLHATSGGSASGQPSLPPDESMEVDEAIAFFGKYLDENAATWHRDNWIVLFCLLHGLPINGKDVQPLYQHGHSAVKYIGDHLREDLLACLRENCSDLAIGRALNGGMQEKLAERMASMSEFHELQKIFEKKHPSTGK